MRRLLAVFMIMISLSGCTARAEHTGGAPNGPAAPHRQGEPATEGPDPAGHAPPAADQDGLYYGRSFLSGPALALYDQVVVAASAFALDRAIAMDASLSDGDVGQVIGFVGYDHPELYWLSAEASGVPRVLRLGVEGAMSLQEVQQRQQEIDRAAGELLQGLAGDAFADSVLLHDRLVEHTGYDLTGMLPDIGNLYGGLVLGHGICDGYVRAYQYLLTKAGIPNAYFAGESGRRVAHSWNAVLLEDGWYYTDLTWNVPRPDSGDTGPYHDYLLVTEAEMLMDHYFNEGQYPDLPVADSTAWNYYVATGSAVDPQEGDFLTRLAEAFVEQLERSLPEQDGTVYLDAKVYCSDPAYPGYKRRFLQGMFDVLEEMKRIIDEKNLPVRIETQGETGCGFNDIMQVIVIKPNIVLTETDG